MIRPSLKALRWVQVLLGSMDTLTGVLLVFAPAVTLKLMGITHVEGSLTMVSWVGVFVFSVGASYFLVGWGSGGDEALAAWRMQWKMSALVRIAVGCFVLWKLITGELEPAWWSVALTDLVVAAGQILGLRQGWLRGRGTL